ncbi:MAG: hypothetical protein QOF53_2585 [Nocardioidaceae bacterium]|nr:hypothetical protein [Nocardioidaceae bacterium]
MQKTFSTPTPVSLFVELRAGDLVVHAGATDETVVEVSGGDADDVTVEQHGDEISVIAGRGGHGFFGSARQVSVHVSVPQDSRLSTKLGSADLRVEGRIGATKVRTGSGGVQVDEIAADGSFEAGSGDIQVDVVTGSLQVKSGSGDVVLDRVEGSTEVSTGSGDVSVGSARQALSVRSGSGDMRAREAYGDVVMSTASGDLVVDRLHGGQLSAKNVSGDIHVGVPAGVPVWTDISTMTGSVRSNLQGAGQPDEGQDHIELRAKTVSGDIELRQL